ncbi:MAG: hypothetical protein V4616_09810 [Bacteroidota bacterium]
MKKILVFAALAVAFTQCKKETEQPVTPTPKPSNTNNQQFGAVPTDANGALYAIRSVVYTDGFGSDSIDQVGPYLAWFGNSSQTDSVGVVECNGTELDFRNPFNNAKYQWYLASYAGNGIGDDITWKVTGSTSFGSFTHVDANPYPTAYNVTYPNHINVGQSMNLKFTTTTCQGVIVRIQDGVGNVVEKIGVSGVNNMTFTAAELKPVVEDIDAIGITIQPFDYKVKTLNGKRIYVTKCNSMNFEIGAN